MYSIPELSVGHDHESRCACESFSELGDKFCVVDSAIAELGVGANVEDTKSF